ncbi:MAG: hypothetical protein P4M15_09780 [Alphaproteobacteria bacterium]|nr:hypothetical protein [Alphaproteobacteria bacterium]
MKKIALLFVVLAFAACSSDGDKKPDVAKEDAPAKKQELKTGNLICPQVAILTEGQQVMDFGGEKPDPAQLVSIGRMKNVEGDCGYRADGIDIKFTLHMMAKRGPRLGGDSIDLPYFIATVDPAEHVLSRQVMTAHFKFSDDAADDDENLHVFIPLAKQEQLAGPDNRVLM